MFSIGGWPQWNLIRLFGPIRTKVAPSRFKRAVNQSMEKMKADLVGVSNSTALRPCPLKT
jgi:hypothetical protein